jgi:hypothetical protein
MFTVVSEKRTAPIFRVEEYILLFYLEDETHFSDTWVTIRLHGVTSQKIVIFKVTALRTLNLTVDQISGPISTAEYRIR